MKTTAKETSALLWKWHEGDASALSDSEKDAIVLECGGDTSVRPDRGGVIYPQSRLTFGRERTVISRWKSGKLIDPLGDNYFDGYWFDRCVKDKKHPNFYVASEGSIEQLKDWLDLIHDTDGETEKTYRQRSHDMRGKFSGSDLMRVHFDEPFLVENTETGLLEPPPLSDYVTVQVKGRGKCALWYRNRGWVRVLDDKGKFHRHRVNDVLDLDSVKGGNEPFWPSAEWLIECAYAH